MGSSRTVTFSNVWNDAPEKSWQHCRCQDLDPVHYRRSHHLRLGTDEGIAPMVTVGAAAIKLRVAASLRRDIRQMIV